MHFVVKPFSLVLFAVTPHVETCATYLIHFEFPFVNGTISKSKLAFAILLALMVKPFINSVVRPILNTESVLFVISPIALVSSTIGMSVRALSVSFVISPLSLVYITISVI